MTRRDPGPGHPGCRNKRSEVKRVSDEGKILCDLPQDRSGRAESHHQRDHRTRSEAVPPSHTDPGREKRPADQLVRVVPPSRRVVKVQGIPGSVDEGRSSHEHVGDVRIDRTVSTQRQDHGNHEGNDRERGRSRHKGFTPNCRSPVKVPNASRPIGPVFAARPVQKASEYPGGLFKRPGPATVDT